MKLNLSKVYFVVSILSLIGMMLAVYLLWQRWFQPEFRPCYINSKVNCDAIISGPVATTLGIPTPLFGLVGYIVIFFAALVRYKRLLLGMASFGLVFCLWIGYRELFELSVLCPVCISCQLVMTAVFILSIFIYSKSK